MTRRVKIYGAGSIGNHLAQASRSMGWDVVVVDKNPEALFRMRKEIYPLRYGSWDEGIELCTLKDEPKGGFDVIMIGTPPDARANLAIEALKEEPKILQLEKPLFTPGFGCVKEFLEELKKHPSTKVVNGYEYVVSRFAKQVRDLLAVGVVGKPQCIDVEIRERWDGIFSAHPWLSGPEDTYLGFWKRGGGACGEHSHGINLWQNLAYTLGLGRVREVTANMKMSQVGKAEYDESCFINLQTEFGHVGRVVQDVVTFPVKCWARVQGDKGFIECIKGYTSKGDLVRYQKGNDNQVEKFIEKNRPDDFRQEVEAIQNILEGRTLIECSPTSLDRGLETMLVVAAAHKSHREKRTVRIEYGKGFCLDALV